MTDAEIRQLRIDRPWTPGSELDEAAFWHDIGSIDPATGLPRGTLGRIANDLTFTGAVLDAFFQDPLGNMLGLPMAAFGVVAAGYHALRGFGSDFMNSAFMDSFTDTLGGFFGGIGDWFQSWFDPIVLDMDGDGVELVGLDGSTARFDFDADGVRERTGWVGTDDALLVFDANGDGVIDRRNEVAFIDYLPGARTDLEGLRAFDANGDGRLSAGDATPGAFDWNRFMVWRDLDQDGVSDAGELTTLADAGIASVDLTRNGNASTQDGNLVHNTTSYSRIDGTTGAASDVSFVSETHGFETALVNGGAAGVMTDLGVSGLIIAPDQQGAIVHGTTQDDVIMFSELNDVFLIRGGAGNDTVIYTGANDLNDFEFQRIDELGVMGVRSRATGETFYVANDVEQLMIGNFAIDLEAMWG